jgi:hypothetical protein
VHYAPTALVFVGYVNVSGAIQKINIGSEGVVVE